MKIIITENQNILVRRYHKIRNEVYNRMDGTNPCYYRDYHDFDKYKRDVLKAAIDEVAEEERLKIDSRSWANFRNELSYMLNDEMKEFYDKEIKERCPEYFEDLIS
jgi:hexokinase